MVIVRLKGGLGNQLFQYATGYALSKRLGCELKVDTSFYPQQSLRTMDLAYFKAPLKVASVKECIEMGAPINFANKIFRKLGLTGLLKPHYFEEKQSFIYDKRFEALKTPVYLDGYWQNLSYFEELRAELSEFFTPVMAYSPGYSKYLDTIQNSQSVSIHIRRGDYVNDPHTRSIHYVCDLEYYINAIKKIEKEVTHPTYFIFSDDIVWCKERFDFLERKVFIDDAENALEDFQLMRNCQSNIISNSTFSWWAAWVGYDRGKDKILIYPSNWQNKLLSVDTNLFTSGVFSV